MAIIAVGRYGYVDFLEDREKFDLNGRDSIGSISSFSATNTKAVCVDLRRNKLTYFEIKNSGNLKMLDLRYNRLTSFGLAGFSEGIRYLDIGNNSLKTFEVTDLKKLEVLDLSGNLISSFRIDNAPNLGFLNLSFNRLKSFSIRGVKRLRKLDLSFNPLEEINLENDQVPRLKILRLVWTDVSRVHRSLASKIFRDAERHECPKFRHGVKDAVMNAFHPNNPIAEEICDHIYQ